MSTNLVAFAKELSRTRPEELPEKCLQLQRRFSSLFQNEFFNNYIHRNFTTININYKC